MPPSEAPLLAVCGTPRRMASRLTGTAAVHAVYFDPKCQWKADELDHSVVLAGYGTDEKEGDFWLIRNSW